MFTVEKQPSHVRISSLPRMQPRQDAGLGVWNAEVGHAEEYLPESLESLG